MRETNNVMRTKGQGARNNQSRGIELASEDENQHGSVVNQHKKGTPSKGSEIGHELCSVKTDGRESCEFVERAMGSDISLNGCSRV